MRESCSGLDQLLFSIKIQRAFIPEGFPKISPKQVCGGDGIYESC